MWLFFSGVIVGAIVPTWMLIQITIWMTRDIERLAKERMTLWHDLCELRRERGVPHRPRRAASTTRFERN